MTLPTFLIIGTMKGGTTSLHRYLRQHPDVFMPEQKELNFFLDEYAGRPIDPPEERNWSRGLTWYERQFAGAEDERAVGEASANYTRYPTYPGVAERIAKIVPEMKLIYLMRNPIDRVLSHYLTTSPKVASNSPWRSPCDETTDIWPRVDMQHRSNAIFSSSHQVNCFCWTLMTCWPEERKPSVEYSSS